MSGIRVLIVGSGGREHALAIGLANSPSVDQIHTCPGNAGTSEIGTNHDVSSNDIEAILKLAKELAIGLVVVGPEAPLVSGLSDLLRENGIPSFGPHSTGAELEGSKLHAKRIMEELGIPTGGVQVLTDESDIDSALASFPPPWVIKRDVLAAGKGVVVTEKIDEAKKFISESISTDKFVLLEEFLHGEEASMLVIMDESGFICLPASQDHKRVGNGDTGPNTGGMGAYAPAPVVSEVVKQRVIENIVHPMHHYLKNQNIPYRGVLYVGLMIDDDGYPNVVEYNVRFGDPETQVTIPLIESDLGLMLLAASEGRLDGIEPRFSNKSAVTVVLASEGYPGPSNIGREIKGESVRIEDVDKTAFVHQAGTLRGEGGVLLSNGGRVLSSTGIANDLPTAVKAAYDVMNEIQLEGSHYRTDIAYRAL